MENLEELMHNTMNEAYKIVNSAKTKDEFLAINGSLLAVIQKTYVEYMGNESTAKLFYSIADKLAITKD